MSYFYSILLQRESQDESLCINTSRWSGGYSTVIVAFFCDNA